MAELETEDMGALQPQAASVPIEGDASSLVITWIGGNCPVQSEGTIDGQPYYFRARGDHWSIEVEGGFVLADAEKGIPETGFLMEQDYGDGPFAAGWMPEEEARAFIEEAAISYRKWKALAAEPDATQAGTDERSEGVDK